MQLQLLGGTDPVKREMEIRINLKHEYCDTEPDLLFLQITTKNIS